MTNRKVKTMKRATLDTLGSQFVSNEIAIISLLQALTLAQPAIRQALVDAMRENKSRVPSSFPGVHERIEQYVELLEKRLSAQAPEPGASVSTVEPLRRQA